MDSEQSKVRVLNKPGSVNIYLRQMKYLPFIYAHNYLRALSVYPSTSDEPPYNTLVYMTFPLIMRTATQYHYRFGGLLPRLFTLTRHSTESTGGYFLLRSSASRQLPVRKYDALCGPDFPLVQLTAPAVSFRTSKPYFEYSTINILAAKITNC